MKIYFNANSKAQVNILRNAGVKNIMLTYKFVGDKANKYANGFDNVMIGPGFGSNKKSYYELIQDWEHDALQYDDRDDPLQNYNNWKEGLEYNEKLIPILHTNYIQSFSIFKPNLKGNKLAIGNSSSNNIEDTQIRQLPSGYSYHGLAKGRWIKNKNIKIDSLDSSTWTSGIRGRKTDVWRGQSLLLGDKGKTNTSIIQLACQKNLLYLSRLGIDPKNLIAGDKNALSLAPIALYYMPMLAELDMYEENFKHL